MHTLSVKGKKGVAVFSGLIFNEENQLEFTNCNLPFLSKESFVVDTNSSKLVSDIGNRKVEIKIPDDEIGRFKELEIKISKELISLYKNILSGEEPLLCFYMGLEDYPYYITTPTILKADIYSSKYTKALEYAFSDECLKRFDIGIYPNFKDYDDLQRRLGKAVELLKVKDGYIYKGDKIIKTTLKEIIKGVK